MSSVLQRSEVTQRFSQSWGGGGGGRGGGGCSRDVQSIPGRVPMGTCDFSVIVSWLLLDLHVSVGVSLRVFSVLLEYLSVGLLLNDFFCDNVTCHYCFFCVYYFKVVHMFSIMVNSPNCDIFYFIIVLSYILLYNNIESNLFNTVKTEKLEYNL